MIKADGLIDSNILIYAINISEPIKHRISVDLIKQALNNEIHLAVSIQNLAEMATVMLHKAPQKPPVDLITRFIKSLVGVPSLHVLSYSARTIISAIEIQKAYSLHFWDALIVATMEEHEIYTIYTEDHHFGCIPWITVINPFNQQPGSLAG